MIWQALLVKRFFVGRPLNIPGEISYLSAISYYQWSSDTYFKVLKYQILSGTTEDSGFSDM